MIRDLLTCGAAGTNQQTNNRHRLCADIMQGGDDGVRRAILFAVGNTVVSDTLDAARFLCSGQDGKKARREQECI